MGSQCSFDEVDLRISLGLLLVSQALFLIVFSGSFKSAEASHLECDHCQCYLWNLLDYWFINLHLKLL